MTYAETWNLPPLGPRDRCDWRRCDAQAACRIFTHGGRDLYACAHHYAATAALIRLAAMYVQDDRMRSAHTLVMERPGRMTLARGMRGTDLCRWCSSALTARRVQLRRWGDFTEYYLCPVCDQTVADMTSLKGMIA